METVTRAGVCSHKNLLQKNNKTAGTPSFDLGASETYPSSRNLGNARQNTDGSLPCLLERDGLGWQDAGYQGWLEAEVYCNV